MELLSTLSVRWPEFLFLFFFWLLPSLSFETCLLYLFFFTSPFVFPFIFITSKRSWLLGYLHFHLYSGFLSLVLFCVVFVFSYFFLMSFSNLLHLHTCNSKVTCADELRKDMRNYQKDVCTANPPATLMVACQ